MTTDDTASLPLVNLPPPAEPLGDRRQAHALAVQLTVEEPTNEQAWLARAATAGTLEEAIDALTRVLALNPAHPAARQQLYEAMQALLRQDAFLAYQGETPELYQLRAPENFQFVHPKDRAAPDPFPPPTAPPAQSAYRWLGLALLGLLAAGLGTLVFAPIAMLSAARLLRQPPTPADRRRGWLVLGTAFGLWWVGLGLSFLLILHLR